MNESFSVSQLDFNYPYDLGKVTSQDPVSSYMKGEGQTKAKCGSGVWHMTASDGAILGCESCFARKYSGVKSVQNLAEQDIYL